MVYWFDVNRYGYSSADAYDDSGSDCDCDTAGSDADNSPAPVGACPGIEFIAAMHSGSGVGSNIGRSGATNRFSSGA